MLGTWNPLRAFFGHLGRSSSIVRVVWIVCPGFGVPSVLFLSWTAATLQTAFIPKSVRDAAESKKAVVVSYCFGLVQPGVTVCKCSSGLFDVLFTTRHVSPAGTSRHSRSDPFGASPNPAFTILPPIGLLRVASFLCPLFSFSLHVALLCL